MHPIWWTIASTDHQILSSPLAYSMSLHLHGGEIIDGVSIPCMGLDFTGLLVCTPSLAAAASDNSYLPHVNLLCASYAVKSYLLNNRYSPETIRMSLSCTRACASSQTKRNHRMHGVEHEQTDFIQHVGNTIRHVALPSASPQPADWSINVPGDNVIQPRAS
jgi:hypothetical protein